MLTKDYFDVKPSTIAKGEKGLFARKNIPVGTFMFTAFYKNTGINTKVFEYQFIQTKINSYINHSETPNLYNFYWPRGKFIQFYTVAKRNIKAGEELTKDYQNSINMIKNLGYSFSHDWLWFKK